MAGVTWPEWWEWELAFNPHIEKRMADRDFTEVDLRSMLEKASGYEPDVVEGRWVIRTKHKRHPWKVIVEPEAERRMLIVVTAYPIPEA